jgi:hypothetical protein
MLVPIRSPKNTDPLYSSESMAGEGEKFGDEMRPCCHGAGVGGGELHEQGGEEEGAMQSRGHRIGQGQAAREETKERDTLEEQARGAPPEMGARCW